MKRVRKAAAVLAISALAVSGCQTTGSNQTSGAVLGGLAGAAAGSQFGSGEGRLVAVVIGALVGAVAGGMIGQQLDEADRLKAEEAARQAANAPAPGPVHWKSEKDAAVHGWAEPVTPARVEDGDLCKNVKSVYYLNGQEQSETRRFCLQDGRWVEA